MSKTLGGRQGVQWRRALRVERKVWTEKGTPCGAKSVDRGTEAEKKAM